jgi:hypothetical protein
MSDQPKETKQKKDKAPEQQTFGVGKYNEPLTKLPDDRGYTGVHEGRVTYYGVNGKPRAPREGEAGYETPENRFRRLAMRRVPTALKHIGYVTNLAKGSAYRSTPEQRAKIILAFRQAMAGLESAFRGEKPDSERFEL